MKFYFPEGKSCMGCKEFAVYLKIKPANRNQSFFFTFAIELIGSVKENKEHKRPCFKVFGNFGQTLSRV